eukprot:TRINITY_DN12413_c0_g1_i1.p2 TRINITY_DN12413_c0_g1~~TRINITY_DN12413_c0_g1_i1.p2  ORF type:complete len:104 (+),score=23.74 TRINITY_DN12413_c0_g1_i1:77-388(+)
MSTPNKHERDVCWGARDAFLACYDAQDALVSAQHPSVGERERQRLIDERLPSECAALQDAMRSVCPASWAKHFLKNHQQTRRMERFQQMVDEQNAKLSNDKAK